MEIWNVIFMLTIFMIVMQMLLLKTHTLKKPLNATFVVISSQQQR